MTKKEKKKEKKDPPKKVEKSPEQVHSKPMDIEMSADEEEEFGLTKLLEDKAK